MRASLLTFPLKQRAQFNFFTYLLENEKKLGDELRNCALIFAIVQVEYPKWKLVFRRLKQKMHPLKLFWEKVRFAKILWDLKVKVASWEIFFTKKSFHDFFLEFPKK